MFLMQAVHGEHLMILNSVCFDDIEMGCKKRKFFYSPPFTI